MDSCLGRSSGRRFSLQSINQKSLIFYALVPMLLCGVWSCARHVSSMVAPTDVTNRLVVGRVVTFLTGDRARRYLPEMRYMEIENRDSQERFQVRIDSPDKTVALNLPSGRYRLTRVQISEGPFLSMAELSTTFTVDAAAVTCVGTWKFGVDSPRYGRMVIASVALDHADTARTLDLVTERYPDFRGRPIVEELPQPMQVEARLYEVMPYPRYPRMFRRHWW